MAYLGHLNSGDKPKDEPEPVEPPWTEESDVWVPLPDAITLPEEYEKIVSPGDAWILLLSLLGFAFARLWRRVHCFCFESLEYSRAPEHSSRSFPIATTMRSRERRAVVTTLRRAGIRRARNTAQRRVHVVADAAGTTQPPLRSRHQEANDPGLKAKQTSRQSQTHHAAHAADAAGNQSRRCESGQCDPWSRFASGSSEETIVCHFEEVTGE